jgi:hypothetical protein
VVLAGVREHHLGELVVERGQVGRDLGRDVHGDVRRRGEGWAALADPAIAIGAATAVAATTPRMIFLMVCLRCLPTRAAQQVGSRPLMPLSGRTHMPASRCL